MVAIGILCLTVLLLFPHLTAYAESEYDRKLKEHVDRVEYLMRPIKRGEERNSFRDYRDIKWENERWKAYLDIERLKRGCKEK